MTVNHKHINENDADIILGRELFRWHRLLRDLKLTTFGRGDHGFPPEQEGFLERGVVVEQVRELLWWLYAATKKTYTI